MPLPPRVKDLGGAEVPDHLPLEASTSRSRPIARHGALQRTAGQGAGADRLPERPPRRQRPRRSGSRASSTTGRTRSRCPRGLDGPAEIRVGLLHDGQRVAAGAAGPGRGCATASARSRPRRRASSSGRPSVKHSTELWSRGDRGWGEELCADRPGHQEHLGGAQPAVHGSRPAADERARVPHGRPPLAADAVRRRDGDAWPTRSRPGWATTACRPTASSSRARSYIAFCATRYNGVDYRTPALFTARSLDGRPIAESSKVRIYHGFGDRRIRLFGKEFEVAKEETVRVK